MAVLTDPIDNQNIVDRFYDYVGVAANQGISWGTNSNPTYNDNRGAVEVIPDSQFGGTTAGKGRQIDGSSLAAKITAQNLFDVMVAETARFTRVRKVRARLFVTGGGGNNGSRQSPGYVYDQTAVAHMSSAYDQGVVEANNLSKGQVVTDEAIEALFSSLRNRYNTGRETTYDYVTTVCHASCHSSCHSSRGRR